MALKVDHVTILFSSMEDSMPYYRTLLGAIGFTAVKPHIWTDGEGFFFQFAEAKPETRPYERYGAGMNHIGFGAPDAETVHRVRDTMAAAGFEVPELQHFDGATALFMKDRDGIRFEITHYPPGKAVVD